MSNKLLSVANLLNKEVDASVDGVLGGYGSVNEADIKESEDFLKNLFSDLLFDTPTNRHLVALGMFSLLCLDFIGLTKLLEMNAI